MAKFCKECGIGLSSTGRSRGGKPFCTPCAKKHDLCTSCKELPQDRPGLVTCSRCLAHHRRRDKKRLERNFARIGKRMISPEWLVRSIEECQQAADQLHAKYAKEPANG